MNKFGIKFWLTLVAEVAIAIALFVAISAWQNRKLLASDTRVPTLAAMTLENRVLEFPNRDGETAPTLLYFFAPWCQVCHLSIGNLNDLKSLDDKGKLNVLIVALAYQDKQEIEQYVAEHQLDYPVILGNQQWQESYKITAFPTYYLVNAQGEIASKSMGYSTTLGMKVRLLIN